MTPSSGVTSAFVCSQVLFHILAELRMMKKFLDFLIFSFLFPYLRAFQKSCLSHSAAATFGRHDNSSVDKLTQSGILRQLLLSYFVSFLLLAHSAHLFLHTCAFPHTPTDGVARIFSLAPMPRPGIEFTLAQLHLFG